MSEDTTETDEEQRQELTDEQRAILAQIDAAVAEAQADNQEPLELYLREDLRVALGLTTPFVEDGTEYTGSQIETAAGILNVLDPPETEQDPGDAMPPRAWQKAADGAAVVVVTRQDYHAGGYKAPDEYTAEDWTGPLDTLPNSFLEQAPGTSRSPTNPFIPRPEPEESLRPVDIDTGRPVPPPLNPRFIDPSMPNPFTGVRRSPELDALLEED